VTNNVTIAHFGLHTPGNAGDTALFRITQEVMKQIGKDHGIAVKFSNYNIHQEVKKETVEEINNTCDLVICGGGGLFLRDTKQNENSGWQWNLPIDLIDEFKKPLYLFSVGYNRFRGQQEFEPIFKTHLNRLAKKANYLGLRNTGSIEKTKAYLAGELKSKVIYQPCATTLISWLNLRDQFISNDKVSKGNKKKIVVNIPFDRCNFRYGKHQDKVMKGIARALKVLEKDYLIEIVFHCPNDINLLILLEDAEVKYTTKKLAMKNYEEVLKYYYANEKSIIISGRGHGQMIPFGIGSLFISLISHNKLAYFLQDVDMTEQGIEVITKNISKLLVERVQETDKNRSILLEKIDLAKEKLWKQTEANVLRLLNGY